MESLVIIDCDESCTNCKRLKLDHQRKSIGSHGIEKYVYRKEKNSFSNPVNGSGNSAQYFNIPPDINPSLSPKKVDINEIYTKTRNAHKRIDSKRYIVHSVIYFNNPKQLGSYQNLITSRITKKNCKLVLKILSVHYGEREEDDHLHILHDCSWSNKKCRCSPFQLPDLKRKLVNAFSKEEVDGDRLAEAIQELHEGSMFCFFFFGYRRSSYQEIIEQKRKKIRNLPLNETTGIVMSLCQNLNNDTVNRSTSQEEIFTSMKKYLVTPLEEINRTIRWLEDEPDKITSVSTGSNYFRNAMKMYKQYYSAMSVDELINLHRSERLKKFYSALNGETWEKYLSEVDSTKVLDLFISHQSAENKIQPKAFLDPIYKILTKSGDKNCLVLQGSSNSGKTWFVNIMADLMINYGFINASDKYPFDNSGFRNLLIYEKCTELPKQIEVDLKNIIAGKDVMVKVTQNTFEFIKRTPIIICTDRDVFPNAYFNSLIHKIQLTRLDYPKYPEKMVHPLALINLFEKYGIRPTFIQI